MEQTSNAEIINIIIDTINTLISNLISSIDLSVYSDLDKIVFVDKKLFDNSIFKKLLDTNGIIIVCDSFLLALTLYYIVKYFSSNYTGIPIEKPYQYLFKLLIITIVIHFSYFICEQLLSITNLISSSIQEICKNISSNEITFKNLVQYLNNNLTTSSFDLFSFDGIIKSITTTGLIELLFSYSIRNIMIQFFILISPFALLSLINYSTNWIFKNWSKCIFSLLALQIFIPIILAIIFSVGSTNKILLIGSMYALTKMNSYMREIFGGISMDLNNNFSSMLNSFKK